MDNNSLDINRKHGRIVSVINISIEISLNTEQFIAVNPEMDYTGFVMPNGRMILVATERIMELFSLMGTDVLKGAIPVGVVPGTP